MTLTSPSRGACRGHPPPPRSLGPTHLGSHHELVVDDVVWRVAHAEERAGRVQVAGHPRADVDVLPYALRQRRWSAATACPVHIRHPQTGLSRAHRRQGGTNWQPDSHSSGWKNAPDSRKGK